MKPAHVRPARMFDIPEAFQSLPRAVRLRRTDAEFSQAIRRQHQAVELANEDWRDLIMAANLPDPASPESETSHA